MSACLRVLTFTLALLAACSTPQGEHVTHSIAYAPHPARVEPNTLSTGTPTVSLALTQAEHSREHLTDLAFAPRVAWLPDEQLFASGAVDGAPDRTRIPPPDLLPVSIALESVEPASNAPEKVTVRLAWIPNARSRLDAFYAWVAELGVITQDGRWDEYSRAPHLLAESELTNIKNGVDNANGKLFVYDVSFNLSRSRRRPENLVLRTIALYGVGLRTVVVERFVGFGPP